MKRRDLRDAFAGAVIGIAALAAYVGANELYPPQGSGGSTWGESDHDALDHTGLTGVGTDLTGLGTDDQLARWNGTDTLQGSSVTVLDTGAVSATGWINVGSDTSATAAGDLAAGDGTHTFLFDASAGLTTLRKSTSGLGGKQLAYFAGIRSDGAGGAGTTVYNAFAAEATDSAEDQIGYHGVIMRTSNAAGGNYADYIVNVDRNGTPRDLLRLGNSATGNGNARAEFANNSGTRTVTIDMDQESLQVGASAPSPGGTGDITAEGDITAAGSVLSQVEVEASTAVAASPNALTALESGKVLTNEGTTAENHHDLPTAAAGLRYVFVVQDSDGIQINANTGDTIRIGSSVSATAGFIAGDTIGETCTVVAINATEWIVVSYSGSWTVDTP